MVAMTFPCKAPEVTADLPTDINVGDWVQRKGNDCGMTGHVVEMFRASSYTCDGALKGSRMKARVRWHRSGYGHDYHSALLASSLQRATPATQEQKDELIARARALGYSGCNGLDTLTYANAEHELSEYRAGHRSKRSHHCWVCNEAHVYDETPACKVAGYALYNTTDKKWAVYDMSVGRAIAPNASAPLVALAVAERLGVAASGVYISEWMRQRAVAYDQSLVRE